MNRAHWLTLGAAAAVAAALLWFGGIVLGGDPRGRSLQVLPDMVESVPFDAYAANPNFADGKTLRPPVAGTIPYGGTPLRYAPTAEGAARAAAELASPYAGTVSAAVVERGRKVFATFCAPCHGTGGEGDGPVTRRGVPPPPSLLAERVRAMKDGQLFHIITFGQGNMPSYAAQVDRDDRWKVVRFVRGLGAQP
jgi:mono/diheme cytochrome c family protein